MKRHEMNNGINKKAFTLVELIIVVTILSILSVIAFISFQGYSGNARDGNKLTTLSNIEKGLSLYKLKTGTYPNPDDIYGTGSYSGTLLMKVGYIGENISRAIQLNKAPIDPLITHNYTYGVTEGGKYYQLGTALETTQTTFFPTTYANNYVSKVVGDYKGLYKFHFENKNYIINLPSLLFTEAGEYNFQAENSSINPKFVIHKGANLVKPYDENNTQDINATLQQLTGTGVSLTGVTIPETKEEWEDKKGALEDLFGYEKEIIGKEIFGEKEYNNSMTPTNSDNSQEEDEEENIPSEEPIVPTLDSCFTRSTNTITGYTCTDKNIIIPSSIGGVNITAIGASAFYNKGLTGVTLPNTITSIGNWSFGINQIQTLTFLSGSNLVSIGHSAFSNNKIQNLTFPNSVTTIAQSAFQMNMLVNIVMPTGIIQVDRLAFAYNNNLASVTNYDGVISNEYIYIPFGTGIQLVDYFGANTAVNIPSQMNSKTVVSIGSYAFNGYHRTQKLTSIILPNTIQTILDSAFSSNAITSINIPNSVTNIGSSAFSMNRASNGRDNSFTSVTNYDGVVSNEYIYFPTSDGTGMEIFEYFGNNRNLTIPNTINGLPVTHIGDFAFYRSTYGNNNLLTLQLPNSLKSIGNQAFDGNALTSITFPASTTSIGTSSFRYNRLTTIRFLGQNTYISNWAFDYQNDSAGNGTVYGSQYLKDTYFNQGQFDMTKLTNFVVQ